MKKSKGIMIGRYYKTTLGNGECVHIVGTLITVRIDSPFARGQVTLDYSQILKEIKAPK